MHHYIPTNHHSVITILQGFPSVWLLFYICCDPQHNSIWTEWTLKKWWCKHINHKQTALKRKHKCICFSEPKKEAWRKGSEFHWWWWRGTGRKRVAEPEVGDRTEQPRSSPFVVIIYCEYTSHTYYYTCRFIFSPHGGTIVRVFVFPFTEVWQWLWKYPI